MEKEMLKYLNSIYQNMKLLINSYKYTLETSTNNVEKYECKMWNLENEYTILRRKKFLINLSNHILTILTFGICKILFKKKYYDKIDNIEEEISKNIFEVYNLKKYISENEIDLMMADIEYKKVENLYKRLEMFFELMSSLSEEEKRKYLSYKIGDSYGKNKDN